MKYTALAIAAAALVIGANFGLSTVSAPVAYKAFTTTTIACGTTPGFCPNPPEPDTWPVGTSGDW